MSTVNVSAYIQPIIMLTLSLAQHELLYADKISYLGIYLCTGKTFQCSFGSAPMQFFRNFNAMYSCSKASHGEQINVELVKAYCIPVLVYRIEATCPSKANLNMMNYDTDSVINAYLMCLMWILCIM